MVGGKGYDIGGTEVFCDMCMVVMDVAELNVANWTIQMQWLANFVWNEILVNST